MKSTLIVIIVFGLFAGCTPQKPEPTTNNDQPITNFGECAAAGFPVMESYPERCRDDQGNLFVAPTPLPTGDDEPVFCTLDAKICPDGSSVGRVGPNCEFAPCP